MRGVNELAVANAAPVRGIIFSGSAQMGREQHVETQFINERRVQNLDAGSDQQHGRMRGGDDFLDKAVTARWVGIGETVEQRVLLGAVDLVEQIAFFLMAKRLAIGDQELQVTRVGRVDKGEIDFVDDAVAQRKPNRSEERRVGKACRSRWSPYH